MVRQEPVELEGAAREPVLARAVVVGHREDTADRGVTVPGVHHQERAGDPEQGQGVAQLVHGLFDRPARHELPAQDEPGVEGRELVPQPVLGRVLVGPGALLRRGGAAPRGQAGDQAHGDAQLLLPVLAGDDAGQQRSRRVPDLEEALAHRGQRRLAERSEVLVVEAGDHDVVGDPSPQGDGGVDGTERRAVVERDDGVDVGVPLQRGARRPLGDLPLVPAGDDLLRSDRPTQAGELRQDRLLAFLGVDVLTEAPDDQEAARPALLHEVPGDELHPQGVVRADRRAVTPAAQPDDGQVGAGGEELVELGLGAALHERVDDDRPRVEAVQHGDQRRGGPLGVLAPQLDHQGDTQLTECLAKAGRQVRLERAGLFHDLHHRSSSRRHSVLRGRRAALGHHTGCPVQCRHGARRA